MGKTSTWLLHAQSRNWRLKSEPKGSFDDEHRVAQFIFYVQCRRDCPSVFQYKKKRSHPRKRNKRASYAIRRTNFRYILLWEWNVKVGYIRETQLKAANCTILLSKKARSRFLSSSYKSCPLIEPLEQSTTYIWTAQQFWRIYIREKFLAFFLRLPFKSNIFVWDVKNIYSIAVSHI